MIRIGALVKVVMRISGPWSADMSGKLGLVIGHLADENKRQYRVLIDEAIHEFWDYEIATVIT